MPESSANRITSKAYFRTRNPNAVTLGDDLYFIAELINIQYVIEYFWNEARREPQGRMIDLEKTAHHATHTIH